MSDFYSKEQNTEPATTQTALQNRESDAARDEQELSRQRSFLALAKEHTKELAEVLGRQPVYHVVNFGCQMNARDAEKLSGILEAAGYAPSATEEADFIIYNTCTVRDNADQHFFGRLGMASHYKEANPYTKIAVCGCMMQEKENVARVRRSYPYVDLIFGTHNIFRFPEYLCRVYEEDPGVKRGGRRRFHVLENSGYEGDGKRRVSGRTGSPDPGASRNYFSQADSSPAGSDRTEVTGREDTPAPFDPLGQRILDVWADTDEIVEELPVERKYPFKSGVNITFGCNNFCTYCIVPFVRGRERSRRPREILREVERLSQDGVVEVMLLGQNVNSYGRDLAEPASFAELLAAVAEVPGIHRVRFMTPHPKDFSEDVIRVMQTHPNIARHVHLPLQSGSNRILKAMNRSYTREKYLSLALHIREALPDAAITTDIIAGFPGETEKDADDTIDVIRQVQYDNAYTFIYSPRRGTPAAAMKPVPEALVKENFNRILAAVQASAMAQTEKLTGTVQTALIEEPNAQDPALVTGRLSNNAVVHVPGDAAMIGRFFDVRLDACRNFYYFGEIVRENP